MAVWNLVPIAERLQVAALDPTLWPETLAQIAKVVEGPGALLFCQPHFTEPPSSPDLASVNEAYLREGWYRRDERDRGLPLLMQKGIITDEDIVSREEMGSLPFYQDFLRKQRIGPFAGLGFSAGNETWVLSIQRHLGQAAFSPDELQQLLTLNGALSDAASLSRQLGFARVLGMSDAFQLTRQPSIILDDRGSVIAMNALAEEQADGLFDVVERKVRLEDRRSQARFDALLHVRPSITGIAPPRTMLARSRHGMQVPIRCIELHGWARFAFTRARFLILIDTNPGRTSDPTQVLKARFGLTNTESLLATELMAGHSLATIAERLNFTYATARSHLRAVFSKTTTHRQAELVALLTLSVGRYVRT